MLSNRRGDRIHAKYSLEHIVRTYKGGDNRSFRSIYQAEDSQKFKGLETSKDLVQVGGDALKTNITTLGPLVLPFSEQVFFFSAIAWKHLFGNGFKSQSSKPYIPDYKLAFEHFCVHAASKTVLDELQRNLGTQDENLEASSSSIWYELAYLEAEEQVRAGDRVWQLAFGSGFKCNSAVWKALRKIRRPSRNNPWLDCIDRYRPQGEF